MPNRKKDYVDMKRFRKTCNTQSRRYYAKTAIYEKRPWTDEEDEKVLAHTVSDTELSSDIRRSVKAIQLRRSRLKKSRQ